MRCDLTCLFNVPVIVEGKSAAGLVGWKTNVTDGVVLFTNTAVTTSGGGTFFYWLRLPNDISGLHKNIKYWILPDIENRIKNGEIPAFFFTSVVEITPDTVVLETQDGRKELKNDFVFALTGYHPDFDFLRSLGIELSTEQYRPLCDPGSLETNVPGIYVAGVIVAGSRTNEIFIENGRFHGRLIASDVAKKLGA